jgi:hypothetical protein
MGNWWWVFLKRENKKKGESAKTLKWRCEEREDDVYKKKKMERTRGYMGQEKWLRESPYMPIPAP